MSANIVTSDPEILGGTPVFTGTRVPVAVLFENLADGLMKIHAIERETHHTTHKFKAPDLGM